MLLLSQHTWIYEDTLHPIPSRYVCCHFYINVIDLEVWINLINQSYHSIIHDIHLSVWTHGKLLYVNKPIVTGNGSCLLVCSPLPCFTNDFFVIQEVKLLFLLFVTISYSIISKLLVLTGMTYTYDATASNRDTNNPSSNQSANVYKCVSCDYLFGNLSDMKRHLRMRHRIHIADMRHSSGQDTLTQIVPMENQDGITSDVQVK